MKEEAAFRQLGPAPDPGEGRGALALLSDTSGRLLLQLRDDRPEIIHPGVWSFFGGGVERGETLLGAMVRELDEELGLQVPRNRLSPFVWLQSDSPRRTRLFLFRAELDIRPGDLRLGEGAGFGFFTPRQVGALPLARVLKPALEAYFSCQ